MFKYIEKFARKPPSRNLRMHQHKGLLSTQSVAENLVARCRPFTYVKQIEQRRRRLEIMKYRRKIVQLENDISKLRESQRKTTQIVTSIVTFIISLFDYNVYFRHGNF